MGKWENRGLPSGKGLHKSMAMQQEPMKIEVPYHIFVGLFFGSMQGNIRSKLARNMILTYLHFGILKNQ